MTKNTTKKKPDPRLERPSSRPRGRNPKGAAEAPQEGETRLAVNIPLRVHRALKIRAAEEGRPMRELVLEIFAQAGFGVEGT